MRQKPGTKQSHGEKVVKDIRRATRKQSSAEEKIRMVLDGLKGEDSIAELCRREGIAQSLYYTDQKNSSKLERSAWQATPPAGTNTTRIHRRPMSESR